MERLDHRPQQTDRAHVIEPAQLQWRDDQPYNPHYDDIYFSRQGVDEVRRVFLEPAHVLAKAKQRPTVTVAELGFGSGLNFAVTAQAILAQSSCRLHFISFEAHPLSAADWQQVASRYEQTLPIYRQLTEPPPALMQGWQQRRFAGGRVQLSLFHGEVGEGLAELLARCQQTVDVWYLDGFAPDKNPQMWRSELFADMAKLSAMGTTVATFSAAGRVKRALQAHGFEVEKVDQQPFKRESIRATQAHSGRTTSPHPRIQQATVLGAGIAGACIARQLAEHGVQVNVYDPQGIAGGASKMRRVVMHARLLGNHSADAAWRAAAFFYAMHYNRQFDGVHTQGVLQIQGPNLNAAKLARIEQSFAQPIEQQGYWIERLAPQQAYDRCGFLPEADALWFAQAAVMDLPVFCASLLDHDNIQVHATHAKHIEGEADNHVVLAAGAACRSLGPYDWLEIAEVYGQLDRVAATAGQPRSPIVGNGYFVPGETETVLGASYEYQPWPVAQASEHNLKSNRRFFSQPTTSIGQQRGSRTVSSDRLPAIGQLQPHQWISTAYGSMGAVGAPLGAAILCAQMLGSVPAANAPIETLLVPQRFQHRQARRGVRHQSRAR